MFFTNHAASIEQPSDAVQSDLIAFLAVAQKYSVDFLPIMWLPEDGTVGEGGCGSVSQLVAAACLNFVFKRFHGTGDQKTTTHL